MAQAAPVAAYGGGAGLSLTAYIKLRDLMDRRSKHRDEFGSLEELIQRVAQQPDVDLPKKLRLLQTTPIMDHYGMGYAALPNLGSKMFGTSEALYTPWTLKRPFSMDSDIGEYLTMRSQGEVLDLSEEALNLAALEAASKQAVPEKPAGRIGAALGALKDALRPKDKKRYLRDRASYSAAPILHELGHLSGSRAGKIRALQGAGMITPFLGSLGGMAASTMEDPYMSYGAPAIAAAGFAPLLVEEARATRNAAGMMENLVDEGVDPANMARLKKFLGPAYGTYLLAAGVPTVAAALISQRMREKRERSTLGDVWAHGEQILGDVGQHAVP
jgi:hypothetical protein